MTAVSRIGDIGTGTCPCHDTPQPYTTTFVTGASTVFINNIPATLVGTIGNATCGHPTTALTGSSTVFIEGLPVHRIADTGANCGPYITVTGAANVFVEG